jgi:hypothetical protein
VISNNGAILSGYASILPYLFFREKRVSGTKVALIITVVPVLVAQVDWLEVK